MQKILCADRSEQLHRKQTQHAAWRKKSHSKRHVRDRSYYAQAVGILPSFHSSKASSQEEEHFPSYLRCLHQLKSRPMVMVGLNDL